MATSVHLAVGVPVRALRPYVWNGDPGGLELRARIARARGREAGADGAFGEALPDHVGRVFAERRIRRAAVHRRGNIEGASGTVLDQAGAGRVWNAQPPFLQASALSE